MDEVKIIYCYDENNNPIHYTKINKNQKYFCIDCGQELICKEGNIKIKHLAHKNITKCRGSGESIIHKHWKENLCKSGMIINIDNNPVEILDVLNEVSLSKRYNKNWNKDIIVDILLETEYGDVVVEIDYKHSKDWKSLIPYYDQLDLFNIYEVIVNNGINNIEWLDLNWYKELFARKEQERIEKEKRKQQKKLMNAENEYKIYLNFKTRPEVHKYPIYYMFCIIESEPKEYIVQKIKFNLANLGWLKKDLDDHVKVEKGIKYCNVKVKGTINKEMLPLEVLEISDLYDGEYNKYLYKLLCDAVAT